MAGQSRESTWKAALFQTDEALVPAFIIEELDGVIPGLRPSIPTPFAGAVYILDRHRVHPLDVPFTDAVKVVSRWGSGAKDLVAAMEKSGKPVERSAGDQPGARRYDVWSWMARHPSTVRTQTSVNQPDCSASIPPERVKRPVMSADCPDRPRMTTLSMRSFCLGWPLTK